MSAFSAQIEANISNFTKNLDKATQDIGKFQDNVAKKLDKVGTSFVNIGAKASILSTAIIGATAGLVKLGIDAGNASAEINNLSTATSLSTDLIQELSYVATASNSSFEGLQSSMNSFQRRLKTVGEEGSKVNEMFGKLGVSTTDASGKMRSMDAVLLDTFNKLGDMENGLAKNAIGAELFGRSWNEVSLIVSSGSKGIAELREEANKLGLVLDENTLQSSDNFATAMELVGFQVDKLKTKIGAGFVPLLQETVLPLFQEKIIPAVSRFADFIGQLTEKFNALNPSTKTAIFALGGIATAVGPVLLGLGGVIKLLPLIGAGFTALAGPVGIAIAGISAGAVLIVKNWDNISKYFTSGGGSELFKTIKALSSNLFDALKTTFNNIKNVVLKVWDSIGSNVIRQLSLVIDTVVKSLTFVTNIINDFLNILRSEPKDVLENLKTFFVNAFTGILDIVKNVLASVTNQLSGFFRLLKLDKWADSLTAFSNKLAPIKTLIDDKNIAQSGDNKTTEKAIQLTDDLTNSLTKLGNTQLIPQGSLKELSEKLKVLYEQLDNETTQSGRIKVSRLINELENKVVRIKVAIDFENALKPITNTDLGVSPIIDLSPQIDKMGADLDRMNNVIKSKEEILAQNIQTMNNLLVGGFVGMFASLGEAIGSGENVLGALSKSIVGALADMAIQIGGMMIGFGSMAESLWSLIATPLGGPLAIAAGAALIALGATAKAAVSGAMGSVGGGGYSGGGGYQSSRVDAPMQQGEFQYRDSYSQQQVEFKISGDNLVGVLDKKQTRNNRNV